MERSHLALWLTTIFVRAVAGAKTIKEADHKKVMEHVGKVYGDEFLNAKGKRYREYVSLVTRAYSEYLIRIGKPIAGIAQIMKAIKVCRDS